MSRTCLYPVRKTNVVSDSKRQDDVPVMSAGTALISARSNDEQKARIDDADGKSSSLPQKPAVVRIKP